jgi:hypothetical protein
MHQASATYAKAQDAFRKYAKQIQDAAGKHNKAAEASNELFIVCLCVSSFVF